MLTLHRFQPRSDSSFRLQDIVNILIQSIQVADQHVVLEVGMENLLEDEHDHPVRIQQGLPGIILMQCLVRLESADEVRERLIAFFDAACELLKTVSVKGRFQIRDHLYGSGNCFMRMGRFSSVPEGMFRAIIFVEFMAAIGDHPELAPNTCKMRFHLRWDSRVAGNSKSKHSFSASVTGFVQLHGDSVDFSFSFPDAD